MMKRSFKTFLILGMGLSLGLVLSASTTQAQNAGGFGQTGSTLEDNNRKLAQALERLNTMQQEFQSIKGQIDASKFLTQESDRVYQDLDVRVSALEDKLDQIYNLLKEASSHQGTSANSGANLNVQQSAEYQTFQSLLGLVNARDYQGAASGFLGFLQKFPSSPYAPQAMFWVGECYYFLGDYARAIQSFQQLVDKYPQEDRVKEAIYRQGLSFARLKKYQEAKLFFQKVMAGYPNTAEAAKAQTRLHRIEEMEKNQMAMQPPAQPGTETPANVPTNKAPVPPPNPPPAEPSSNPGVQPGVSANRPIVKPSPYPNPNSAPKSESQEPPDSAYDKNAAPLF